LKLSSLCFQLGWPPNKGDDRSPLLGNSSSITYDKFLTISLGVLLVGIFILSGLLERGIGHPSEYR